MDCSHNATFRRLVGTGILVLTVGCLSFPGVGLGSDSGPPSPTASSAGTPSRTLTPPTETPQAVTSQAAIPSSASSTYDPLATGRLPTPASLDLTVSDAARNRNIPIRIYLPSATKAAPAPVILFSPGLGGARDGYSYLARHWATRGYVTVVLQHPGSDDAVWKGLSRRKLAAALKEAMSVENFILRAKDVVAVLNQLGAWNRTASNPLSGRLDLTKVGMAGHSYGAITTEAVSGESFSSRGPVLSDQRITAALAMSPSPPRRGDPAPAFASVRIPWMLMTGTEDVSPIGEYDAASRLAVYPHLHHAAKYQLVLDRAEHSAFSDRELPSDRHERDPRYHAVILALSTAFWDTYLRGDPLAAAWLNGSGPRSVLAPADRWELALWQATKPVKP